MKKLVLLSSFFLFFSFFLVNSAEARSGCCSHHGGVCGCGCCDGTPLSATCAPYYPSCNSDPVEPKYVKEAAIVKEENSNAPVYKAAAVMSSVEANNSNTVSPTVEDNQIDNKEVKEITPLTEQPKQTLNLQDNTKVENNTKTEKVPLAHVSENKTRESDDNGFWGGLIFWGVVGYIIYLVKKKKDKKKNNT